VVAHIASEVYKSRGWISGVSNEGQHEANYSNKERGKKESSVDLNKIINSNREYINIL
jgi:hypothetical protein